MINPATGLEMTFAETLTAVEYEKVREERYNAGHAANSVWSDSELNWIASTGITVQTPAPVETPTVQAE